MCWLWKILEFVWTNTIVLVPDFTLFLILFASLSMGFTYLIKLYYTTTRWGKILCLPVRFKDVMKSSFMSLKLKRLDHVNLQKVTWNSKCCGKMLFCFNNMVWWWTDANLSDLWWTDANQITSQKLMPHLSAGQCPCTCNCSQYTLYGLLSGITVLTKTPCYSSALIS
jgi:hypothetical protein